MVEGVAGIVRKHIKSYNAHSKNWRKRGTLSDCFVGQYWTIMILYMKSRNWFSRMHSSMNIKFHFYNYLFGEER